MNYLKQILAFNQRQLLNPLSQGQVVLWHALMNVNNDCAWIEWFTVANSRLELFTQLSLSGLKKARNELVQKGLIEVKSNGIKATSYKIVRLYEENEAESSQDSNLISSQVGSQDSSRIGSQVGSRIGSSLNKQNKTKQNKTKVNNDAAAKACENVLEFYQANFGMLSPFITQDLKQWVDDLGDELVLEALKRTTEQGAQYSYAKSIMKDWANKGITTLEQAKTEQLQFQRKRQTKQQPRRVELVPDWASDPTTGKIKPSGITFNPEELFGGGSS